jgi:hypothetical protein
MSDDEDVNTRGHGLFLLPSDALEASNNSASILLQSLGTTEEVCMQNKNTIT